MAVAAFQSSIGMCTVGEGIAHIFMAIGAQLGYGGSAWGLRMWVMASLALNIGCMMGACFPLISSGFVTGSAELGIWDN